MTRTFAASTIIIALLTGDALARNASAAVSDPANGRIVAAVDEPAPKSWGAGEPARRGGQAARIEFDDANLDKSLSAWYRLAYIDGGTRLQVFEHSDPRIAGAAPDIERSENTAWRVANEAVGPYGASTESVQVPTGAHVRTGNTTGPSAGLIFTLAFIDQLTPGALVGNLRVAGTGGIGPDGVVFPVSGIEVKVAAAILARPDVIFTPRPSELIDNTTIVESRHTRYPDVGYTVAEWLNVFGYEQAGRDAAGHPGTVDFVVVHDIRQVLAYLCGRTNDVTTCAIAHRSAGIPIGTR
jgi:hypothetical protein